MYAYDDSQTGDFLRATFEGDAVKGDYYFDSEGVRHNITKIITTFSNLNASSQRLPGSAYEILLGNGELSQKLTNEVALKVDSSTFGSYMNATGVSVKYDFYDDNGLVSFPSGTYLVINSINNNGVYDNHVEHAELLSSGSAENLFGSSVSANGNTLVSPQGNTLGTVNNDYQWEPDSTYTDHEYGGNNWDNQSSPYFYFGSGLFSIQGSSPQVRFYTGSATAEGKEDENSYWFGINTAVPTTPGPSYKGPEKPTPKTTATSYHYDKTFQNIPHTQKSERIRS